MAENLSQATKDGVNRAEVAVEDMKEAKNNLKEEMSKER